MTVSTIEIHFHRCPFALLGFRHIFFEIATFDHSFIDLYMILHCFLPSFFNSYFLSG